MFTLLHISDLHRSRAEPVSNDDLVASLLADRDRYRAAHPRINDPDAIIVSGDLIQGAPLDRADYEREIGDQYEVAHAFISELAVRFVEGDRSRVILVPGNHDVSWNVALSAMELVPPEAEPPDLLAALGIPGTPLRWSWPSRRVYRISDSRRYAARLAAFWDFCERFYAGVALAYPFDRSRGFNLFELDDRRLVVATFDSCDGNDCFSSRGAIADGAVARSNIAIRDSGRQYDLHLAVWHHSIQGPPHAADYMDIETIYDMIGYGYRVGLHGHQHRAEASPYSIHLPGRQTMAVISAGSLCAGGRELPRGVNRQYNIIELADDYTHARVHVRTMLVGRQFGRHPIPSFGGESYVDIEWGRAVDPLGRPIDERGARLASAIVEAESLLRRGHFDDAVAALEPLVDALPEHGRRVFMESLRRAQNWPAMIRHTSPPRNIDELLLRCEAFRSERHFDSVRRSIEEYGDIVGLPAAIRTDVLQGIDAEEGLHA